MKRLLLSLLALALLVTAHAQDDVFIFDMPDDFAELDTIAHPARFKSIHMIGVSYGASWSGVSSSPKRPWHRVRSSSVTPSNWCDSISWKCAIVSFVTWNSVSPSLRRLSHLCFPTCRMSYFFVSQNEGFTQMRVNPCSCCA